VWWAPWRDRPLPPAPTLLSAEKETMFVLKAHLSIYLLFLLCFPARGLGQVIFQDPSNHQRRFVTVEEGVRLEVLDWGGSGRPVVLLAGSGNTAHVFDDFAPELTSEFHVYGVTRRGSGASGAPASGYESDRLGDDGLAVLAELEIDRPIF